MLQIQHLTIRHKKDLRVLLEDFALTLNPGDKAALIGEEGNGKSTLLQWLAAPECIAPYAEAEGQRVLTGEPPCCNGWLRRSASPLMPKPKDSGC